MFHQAETGASWELCGYIKIAVWKVQGLILHKAMTMTTMIPWGRGVNGGGCIGVCASMVPKVKHIKHHAHYTDGLAMSPKLMWWGCSCITCKVIGIGDQTGCVSGLPHYQSVHIGQCCDLAVCLDFGVTAICSQAAIWAFRWYHAMGIVL
jgi:hypothetical protein